MEIEVLVIGSDSAHWGSTSCYDWQGLSYKFWVYHRPQIFESIHIIRDIRAKSPCSSLFGTDNPIEDSRNGTQRGYPVLINRVDVCSRPWFIISHSLVGSGSLRDVHNLHRGSRHLVEQASAKPFTLQGMTPS